MNGADVVAAGRAFTAGLSPYVDRDWSTLPVPGLDLNVAQVVAHVATTVAWYALDLSAGRREVDVVRPTVDPATAPAAALVGVDVAATMLAHVINGSDPAIRGFHPSGWVDPDGFAAMACDELLVHGEDACRAFGVELVPPDGLPARVLERLFPDVARGAGPPEDAWTLLLWANDRMELPGRGRTGPGWRWQAAVY